MAANGHISLEDFRVINSQKSLYFHNYHSTELYPEWPLAAVRHVPIDLAQGVSLALLRMPETSNSNLHAHIKGWTAPLDYQPVHALMQELQVGPYEQMGKVSLVAIVANYTGWIIALMVLIVVLMRWRRQFHAEPHQRSPEIWVSFHGGLARRKRSLVVCG